MRADQREAFEALVRTRSTPLLRYGYVLTRDWQLAEDLLQASLARAYVRWPRLEDPQAGEAYVRRVMTTTHASWWRRRWRGELPTERLPESGREDGARAVDERDRLHRALMTLPPRQRAVLALRFFMDLSEQQVADELGCSVGTVKSTTSRALARLRRLDVLAVTEEVP